MAQQSPLLRLLHERLLEVWTLETNSPEVLATAAEAVRARALREALLQHAEDSVDHLARLEEVFSILKIHKLEKSSLTSGLVEDLQSIVQRHRGSALLDAAVICAVQIIEHHEMAIYGTLREWSEQLDQLDAFEVFQSILEEEAAFDADLSELAEAANDHAAS
jgi:ferritin-like metal-binding protein YciE